MRGRSWLRTIRSAPRQDRIDRALLKEMGGLGLIGVDLPEKYGGLGESSVTAGRHHRADRLWRFQRQLRSVAGVADGRHDRPARLARHRAGMAAARDARRSHHRPRPDRAARRVGCRQPHPARREIRQRLPSQRRKDLDELFGPMRRRGHLRAHRQGRGRRPRRQRLLCRSQPERDHPHAFRRHRHQAGRSGLGLLRRRVRPGRMPDGRGKQGLLQDHVRLRLQPRPDRPRMHRPGPGLGRRSLAVHAPAGSPSSGRSPSFRA